MCNFLRLCYTIRVSRDIEATRSSAALDTVPDADGAQWSGAPMERFLSLDGVLVEEPESITGIVA